MKFIDPATWDGGALIETVVVLAFCIMTGYVLMHGATDNNTLNQLIGALTAAFIGVVNHRIGSTVGSKAKDEVIAQLATNGSTPK